MTVLFNSACVVFGHNLPMQNICTFLVKRYLYQATEREIIHKQIEQIYAENGLTFTTKYKEQ